MSDRADVMRLYVEHDRCEHGTREKSGSCFFEVGSVPVGLVLARAIKERLAPETTVAPLY